MGPSTRKGSARVWILSVVITLLAVAYQRSVGPTTPLRGSVQIGDQKVSYRFARSHGGPGDYRISISVPDTTFQGWIVYRRLNSPDPWWTRRLIREGGALRAEIPHQPPAGKIIYRIDLGRQIGDQVPNLPESAPGPAGFALDDPPSSLPRSRVGMGTGTSLPRSGAVVLRFRGAVPAAVLAPHVALMFFGMLVSTRAGLEALRRGGRVWTYAWLALALLVSGGLAFGPAVQWYSFGQAWTGVPFGWDLTDNKTLIAVLAWIGAILLGRRNRGEGERRWFLAAALITLIIFSIPHSLLGSELDYMKTP